MSDSLDEEVLRALDGPSELRAARIEALRRAHPERVDRILAGLKTSMQSPTIPGLEEDDDLLGRDLGQYRIREKLGAGHFGAVYGAEQLTPRRRVAVKVIKPGMDSKEVVARFHAERQAMALLNHPCIARVFDAGWTPRGRPYFVMEYVDGRPIVRFAEQEGLGVPARLAIFAQLCDAVQHAHQKGILHRDLSSNNVLVTRENGRIVPKVIDFGIAKSLHGRLTEHSVYTKQDQVFGTPEFMSPEQATGAGHDIDTRTDIYALGVVLYQLLTGTLPLPAAKVRDVGPIELAETIRKFTPESPSARVRRSGNADLARVLAGDLDWIVAKAMAKDREERYTSAAELAADVQRYVVDEPILAGPPSTAYRLRKFLRRNRWPVLGGSVVLVSLVVALAVTVVGNARIRDARAAAQSHLDSFRRLGDRRQLGVLEQEAEALWPETAARVPAMTQWLTRAEEFTGKLPTHEATLISLRSRATTADGNPPHWQFAAPDDQILHDATVELVEGIRSLREQRIPAVQRRLAWAQTVRAQTVDSQRAMWQEAIAAIADPNGKYGGLALAEQPGLVPLRPDPQSELWEFWMPRSGEAPRPDAAGELVITGDSGMVFVLLAGGQFAMGAQKGEGQNHDPEAERNEGPVHAVTLAPFFLSKYELTQGQWQRLSEGGNPSRYPPGTEYKITLAHPVEFVDWTSCRRLLACHELQLPTEAQWEYGARGGKPWPWWHGPERRALQGARGGFINIADASAAANGLPYEGHRLWPDYNDHCPLHAPVDQLKPSPFGLYHVLGNVWEWCEDGYCFYDQSSPRLGDGLREPRTGKRVVRGGSFANGIHEARNSHRVGIDADSRSENIGVRPARAVGH